LAFGIWFLSFGSYFFGSRRKRPKTDPVEFTARIINFGDSGTSGEADLRAEPAATGQINQERKWISKRFAAKRQILS